MIGIIIVVVVGWIAKKLLAKPAKPNTAIYWIKYLVAKYFYAKAIKKKRPPTFSYTNKTSDLGKLGIFNPTDAWEKDCPRPFPDGKHGADVIDIWGGDKQGNLLLISLWRRPDRLAEVSLYLKLASGDTYQLPSHPDTIVHHTDGKSFSAAGLRIEIHEPLRRCRVTFNGLLRKGIKHQWSDVSTEDNVVNVRFCFTWHAFSMYHSYNDFQDVSMIADSLARSPWTRDTLRNPKFLPFENFENWGHWYGRINIDEEKEIRLLLRGSRERKYGDFDWKNLQQWVIFKGYTQKGNGIHIEINNTTETIKNVINGYMAFPSELKRPMITSLRWNIETLASSATLPSDLDFDWMTTDKEKYALKGRVHNENGFRLFGGSDWASEILVSPITFKLPNGDDGYGYLFVGRPYVGRCAINRPTTLPQIQDIDLRSDRLVVNLDELVCRNSQLVGGKGASLANLTKIKNELQSNDDNKFAVPAGFCVTKLGFELMVKICEDVHEAVCHLENVAGQKVDGSLQQVCQSCVDLISKTEIPDVVRADVARELEKLIGKDFGNNKFAIRSSAIGEDSEELSSAGQNETYLGITGLENICEAVAKCWASQFSFRSVEYRRQYGQPINGGMGVVIQIMIPAESAGVLFSRDPLTGSNSKMIITSNFGLGESVVSALSDPDTIVIRRNFNDDLEIAQKQIGAKNMKIVISDDGGTIEEAISKVDSERCSLSDHIILRLGHIALYLEKLYGNARDLEWAVTQSDLFILQSRPVTTGAIITDDEIMHEFDTGLRTDCEAWTNANLGEVMPGALTPLTLTADRRVHGTCFMKNPHFNPNPTYDPTSIGGTFIFYNQYFFDRVRQKCWSIEEEKSTMTKSMEIGFYGRVLDDDDIQQLARERYPFPGYFQKIMSLIYPFMGMVIGKRFMKNAEEKYRNFPLHAEGAQTAKEAFQMISDKVMSVEEILMGHIQVMMGSNLWNFLIFKILAGNSRAFTLDHYRDFAVLVGSGNGAESGDVPFSMTELSNTIVKSQEYKNFSSLDPEEALKQISKDNGAVGKQYHEFIRRHGHRGLREFEMRSPSWGMNPISFIKILQSTVKGTSDKSSQKNKALSIKESIDKIQTRLGFIRKKLLSFVICGCKSGVCYREQAKSMMIKVEDSLRKSFCLLAKYMVNEGMLPDPDLIYFLTFEEVGQVINTRSSSLIARAQKRRRLYPKMDAIHFDELCTGFPEQWDKETEVDNNISSVLELKAYPVCQGSVKGIARVITSLHDAHQIQRGDILITHATDIGWSPYFPMLSGIVTELGGLISHGAVVAREYGLPCLVAATKATQLFKSGDLVHLDSNSGTLRKLS